MTRTVGPSRDTEFSASELRGNRRALLGLLVVTIVAAIAAGIGIVARIIDDDAGRPHRSGVSTLDGTRREPRASDEDNNLGLLPIAVVGVAVSVCIAAPLVGARRRRGRAARRTIAADRGG